MWVTHGSKWAWNYFYSPCCDCQSLQKPRRVTGDRAATARAACLSPGAGGRALLSKQQRASWCGLSFPPSWPRYSTRGSRSVGKTSVKERRGSVYLSLLVGHDSHFDLSAEQLLERLAGSTGPKVTVSAAEGWSGPTGQHLPLQGENILQIVSRCSQSPQLFHFRPFIMLQMSDRRLHKHIHSYSLLISQQQSKDLKAS